MAEQSKVEQAGLLRDRSLADAHAEIRALRAEVAALRAWSCATCGARFSQQIPAALLDGVARCSSCADAESLRSELAQARAELQTLQESQTFVSLSRQAAASFQGGRLSRNDEVEKLKSRLLEALALLKEVTVHQDRTGTVDPWWPGWRTRVDALTQERG